jgi:hypothetical protein
MLKEIKILLSKFFELSDVNIEEGTANPQDWMEKFYSQVILFIFFKGRKRNPWKNVTHHSIVSLLIM